MIISRLQLRARLASSHGFTLVELLVVILIIAILMAVAAPSFLGQTGKAQDSTAQQNLVIAYKAAKIATLDNPDQGSYASVDASALENTEPELNFANSAADPTTPDTINISHDGSGLVLKAKSGSGKLCTLTAPANGTQSMGCAKPTTPSEVAPSVYTWIGTPTGLTTATVDGSVNPAGQTTTYKVEYGPSSSDWCMSNGSSGSPASSTTAQTLGFTDATSHDVSVDLIGLSAGTQYCADLVATNGSGSGDGGWLSFTAGAPSVNTWGGIFTGATTATVDGSVNPAGQTTTYKVEYGTADSDWCTSGGSWGSPAYSTTPQTLAFTDGTSHDVSVDLIGLSAETDYCANLVATNGSGSGDGAQVSFTAGI